MVGAPGEASAATGIDGDQNDNSAGGAGAVYVFARSGDNWQQQAYIKASNNRGKDFAGTAEGFGNHVSLSADGNTLAVSSPYEDSPGTGINGNQIQDDDPYTRNTGAVYVFARDGENWQQQAYIKADTNESNGYFGHAINLSADGKTLAVSVYDYDPEGENAFTARGPDYRDFFGAIYVFVRTAENWKQQAFLRSGAGRWEGFGDNLSLSADGNVLAASNGSTRSVQMFERTDSTWEYKVSLQSSNEIYENFGGALSLSADGSTLAVGAPEEDRGAAGIDGYLGDEYPNRDSGAVYVFTRPNGIWQQLAYVKASNSAPDINFGFSVSLSANGDTMAVGANEEANATTGINGDQHSDQTAATGSGAVYLY